MYSSLALARPDRLCNGNWGFTVPAGVTNHQRWAAWGRKDQKRCFGLIVQPRLPLIDFLTRLPRLPAGTRTLMQARHAHKRTQTGSHTHDTHTTHTLLVHLLQHNGRLGRMCARDHILPSPFLAVWWVSVAHMSEAENTPPRRRGREKWIRRWLKTTMRMKRKRGCASTSCRLLCKRVDERLVNGGQEARGTVSLGQDSHGSVCT